MDGAWIVLQGDGRTLGLRDGRLTVELKGEIVERLRRDQVEQVHLFGSCRITPAARSWLLREAVDVLYFTARGAYLGCLHSRGSTAGERRLAQLRSALQPARRLAIAQALVDAKLRNQYNVLTRYQRQIRQETLADILTALRAVRRQAGEATDLDVLRGHEGFAARLYFRGLGHGLRNPLFQFQRRTRRPPKDAVNACLSLGYTLLYTRAEAACRAAGLDPYVGFLHQAGRGHDALASDLMEEWRPMVDAAVLSLFNRRQFAPEDFITPEVDLDDVGAPPGEGTEEDEAGGEGRAVHLGSVARPILYQAIWERLRAQSYYPPREARYANDDILRMQAAHLAACCQEEGRAYQGFTIN